MAWKYRFTAILGAIAVGTAALTPANAQGVKVIFAGTVTGGSDLSGVFGTPAADLTGKSFVAVYNYNFLPVEVTTDEDDGGSFVRNAGSLNASMTIDGHLFALTGNNEREITTQFGGFEVYASDTDVISSYVGGYHRRTLQLTNFSSGGGSPTSLTDNFAGMPQNSGGSFSFIDFNRDVSGEHYTQYTVANFNSSTVTVEAFAAAVPEPATWAMMIVGFGMVSVTVRRRNRPSVFLA